MNAPPTAMHIHKHAKDIVGFDGRPLLASKTFYSAEKVASTGWCAFVDEQQFVCARRQAHDDALFCRQHRNMMAERESQQLEREQKHQKRREKERKQEAMQLILQERQRALLLEEQSAILDKVQAAQSRTRALEQDLTRLHTAKESAQRYLRRNENGDSISVSALLAGAASANADLFCPRHSSVDNKPFLPPLRTSDFCASNKRADTLCSHCDVREQNACMLDCGHLACLFCLHARAEAGKDCCPHRECGAQFERGVKRV